MSVSDLFSQAGQVDPTRQQTLGFMNRADLETSAVAFVEDFGWTVDLGGIWSIVRSRD